MQTNLHPAPMPDEDQLPPLKKIRKRSRSCWECKEHNVRCYFVSDGDQSCHECLKKGTDCSSQDEPEAENTRELELVSINDRLGGVEFLLERVLSRLDTVGGIEEAQALASAGDDDFDSSMTATPVSENARALSPFDNELDFQRSNVPSRNITLYGSTSRDLTKLCHKLLDLLPSESAMQRLEESSTSWWLFRVRCFLNLEDTLLPILAAARTDNDPTAIARALLWISLCLQQLPRGFDVGPLRLLYPPKRLITEYLRLASSISSDETLISSTAGLESLVLQGTLYDNDGKLRSAWLSYRRALNVAQIIGLHRLASDKTHEPASLSRPIHLWRHVISMDRYLSFILGMHHGITDAALDFKQSGHDTPNTDPMDALSRIAGSIIERNQKFNGATLSMVRITQTIDAEIMSINHPFLIKDSDAPTSSGKSLTRAQTYNKLMSQLWYHQLIAWIHLPFLLESGTKGGYDYSRERCLEASRRMISYYVAIRRLTADGFCCKSLDFQALTAAVTLLINILGPTSGFNQSASDWPAIECVITSLEKLADAKPPHKIATHGLSVLRFLKRVATRDSIARPDNSSGIPPTDGQYGRIKVQIPYFAIISLECHPRNDNLPRTQHTQQLNAGSPILAYSASNTVLPPNVGNTRDASIAIHAGTWPETHLQLGPIDTWFFDPDLRALDSFLPSFKDDWDLGL